MATPTTIKGDLVVTGNISGTLADATATTKGVVKQAANVAAVASDANAAALATGLNAVLTALKGAGIMAADATS